MKTIFLDRDGVINPLLKDEDGKVSPQNLEEFKFFPKAKSVIEKAKDAGFQIIVLTNQPDVGKDWRELDTDRLEKMNRVLRNTGVNSIYACTHGPLGGKENSYYSEDGEILVCDCRKPQSGLLRQAARDFEIDFSKSYIIGDSVSDIKMANNYELEQEVCFKGKYGVGDVENADRTFDNLYSTMQYILEEG